MTTRSSGNELPSKPEDFLQQVGREDIMRQLGGNDWGNNMPMNGLLQMGMGFLQGSLGQGPSTQSVSQHGQAKKQQEFSQQYIAQTMGDDKRIPNMLQTIGSAVGGEEAGASFRNTYEGMPPFLQNMIQTMTNQSGLGQLMGGDPTAVASASMSMLGRDNQFTTPQGMGGVLGDSTSAARMSMATDVNKQIMGHFQDQTTGLEVMDRTQGMGFENVGKMMNAMSASGQISSKDLVTGIGEEDGEVQVDPKKMDGVKKKLSQGMELLRNFSDVFGGKEFSELMQMAEKVAGLEMEDPSSMKRSLTAVRNARGVAASIGMDERHALGMLAQANDTSVAMGMDRNVAAAFNNANFGGAMVQGAKNMASGSGPFNDEVFRRKQSAEDVMRDRTKMTNFMLQEAENDVTGDLSRGIMLEAFMAKNPEAMKTTIKEGPNKGKILGEVLEAGMKDKSENRGDTLAQLVSTVKQTTGTDLDERAYTVGIKDEMQQLDRKTLDKIATDTLRAEELSRNQDRVASHYLPMQLDAGRAARAISDSNLGEDEKVKRLEGIETIRDMAIKANEFGGNDQLALMSGVLEGREGEFIHKGADGKSKVVDASKMDDAERLELVAEKLMEEGDFESMDEARVQAEKMQAGVKALQNMEKDTGVFAKRASETYAALGVDTSQDFSLSAYNTSDRSIEQGVEAGEIGGKRFMGGPAAVDPLQNFIYGVLGEDARTRRQSALEQVKEKGLEDGSITVTDLDADDLGLTNQQRSLFSKMQDPDSDKDELSDNDNVQMALTDFQQRTMAELKDAEITGDDGEKTTVLAQMAKDAGVGEAELVAFEEAGVQRANLEEKEANLRKQLKAAKEASAPDPAKQEALEAKKAEVEDLKTKAEQAKPEDLVQAEDALRVAEEELTAAQAEGGGMDRKAALSRVDELRESEELSNEEALKLKKDVVDTAAEDSDNAVRKKAQDSADRMRARDQGITVQELREQRAQRLEEAGIVLGDGDVDPEAAEKIAAAQKKVETAQAELEAQAGTPEATEAQAKLEEAKKELEAMEEAQPGSSEDVKKLQNEIKKNKEEQGELTKGQLDTYAKLADKLGAGSGGRAEFIDNLEQLGIVTTFRKKDEEELRGELSELEEQEAAQQKTLDEATTDEEKKAAQSDLDQTKAEILEKKQALPGEDGAAPTREEFALELVQKEGTVLGDDDEETTTALEEVKKREGFERTLAATRARSFSTLKDNLEVSEEMESIEAGRARFKELSEQEGELSEEDAAELETLGKDSVMKMEGEVSREALLERVDKKKEARFEELSGMDPKDLSDSEASELNILQSEKDIDAFLDKGDESDSSVTSGSVLKARKDFLKSSVLDDDEFRKDLQTEEGVKGLIDSGLTAKEIRGSLTSAQADVRGQMKEIAPAEGEKASDEYKALEAKMEELTAAKENLQGQYGEGSGGILAELVDVLTRVFDGGKPLPVVMQ